MAVDQLRQHAATTTRLPAESTPEASRLAGMVYLHKQGVPAVETVPALPPPPAPADPALPSVSIVVPTCFHRRKYHATLYAMMAAQDYRGRLEFLVLDGACHSKSACNSKLLGAPSEHLSRDSEASRDSRLRYVFLTNATGDVTMRSLGEKRNWRAPPHAFPTLGAS